MSVKYELVLPEQVDTLQLSSAVKTVLAASLNADKKIAVSTSSAVVRPTFQITTPNEPQPLVVKLIEPNAIVRFITGNTQLESKLIDFDEKSLYPAVSSISNLTPEVSEELSKLLPTSDTSAEAIILFGDLQALVMARTKVALAADASVTMWHQKLLNEPRIKSAILPVFKLDYARPPKNDKKSSSPAAAGAAAGVAAGVAAGAGATKSSASQSTPKSVEVPKAEGPTVDSNVELKPEQHPILPKKGSRNVLITSALPYVNNVPHLGNIVGSTLSADFYARYAKARGYNALFICGTDEYGTATETKALEEKVTPLELCTHFHKIHKEVYDWFGIEFDKFGRTSTDKQTEIAQEMFLKLLENKLLKEQTSTQLYCEEHQGFLSDRYVEGTCPRCHYEDARGDQCDGCGQLLDPLELIKPRCKLDNSTPVQRETKHMYLELDKIQPRLEEWLATASPPWPKNAQTIVRTWLKEGLRPRSITRDLKWGTPVPLEGYEKKVLYVWFDAPIGYPSITANYTDEWKQWWKPENPDDINLVQFMGKDNAPFHAVVFPSSEIGAKDGWKLVDYLSTTEFLNYEGGKFSKSRNIGVFGSDAKLTGISPSVWRYYLACARPETSDTQFSWADFVNRNNGELLANLGNFVNRVVKFTIAKYQGGVPQFTPPASDSAVLKEFNERLHQYVDAMERVQIREGIEIAMRFSARGNQYLQDSKLDNTLFAEHPELCAQVIGTSLNMIYVLSALIYPFMPDTSKQIWEQLNVPARTIPDDIDFAIKPGHHIGKAQYLFSRIDSSKIDEWFGKFGGGATLQKEIDEDRQLKKEKKLAKKAAMKGESETK